MKFNFVKCSLLWFIRLLGLKGVLEDLVVHSLLLLTDGLARSLEGGEGSADGTSLLDTEILRNILALGILGPSLIASTMAHNSKCASNRLANVLTKEIE